MKALFPNIIHCRQNVNKKEMLSILEINGFKVHYSLEFTICPYKR